MEQSTPEPVQGNSKEDIIGQLLEKAPKLEHVELNLPSKNKYYTLPDPGLPITMRPMTFEDEKFMVTGGSGGGELVNALLTRCVDNLDISQLFLPDKMYLLLKLREISYGKDFSASLQCTECDEISEITFDLSKLPVKYIEDDFQIPVLVELPVIEHTAKIVIPRVHDEPYLKTGEVIMKNLWRLVTEIGGRTEKDIISAVIDKLPLKDAHVITQAIMNENYFGVETEVKFVCPSCKHQEVLDMPITSDFFTVS